MIAARRATDRWLAGTVLLPAIVSGVLAAACGRVSTAPSTSASLSVGQWSGTTAQGAAITFVVSADEILTTISVRVQFQRLLRNSVVLESECLNGTRHHLYPRTVFGRHFVVSVLGLFDRRTRVWPDHHAERPVPSWRSSAGRGHVQGLPRVRNRGIRGMDGNEALIATHSRAPRFRVPGSSQASLERRRDQEPGAWNPEP